MIVSFKTTGSFTSSGNYLLRGSVEFTETRNLTTDDGHNALKMLAYTAIHAEELKRSAGISTAGRKAKTPPGLNLIVSWHEKYQPTKEEMTHAVDGVMEKLGLRDHQALLVAHNDRPHKHVHALVSLVHPETGVRNRMAFSKTKASAFALEYQIERNRLMDTPKRKSPEDIEHARQGIKDAWERSTNAVQFRSGLKQHQLELVRNGDTQDAAKTYVINEKKQLFSPIKALEISTEDYVKRFEGYRMRNIPTKEKMIERMDHRNGLDRKHVERSAPQVQERQPRKTDKQYQLDANTKRQIASEVDRKVEDVLKRGNGRSSQAPTTERSGKEVSKSSPIETRTRSSRDYDDHRALDRQAIVDGQTEARKDKVRHFQQQIEQRKEQWKNKCDFKKEKHEILVLQKKLDSKGSFSFGKTKLQNEIEMRTAIHQMNAIEYTGQIRDLKNEARDTLRKMDRDHAKELRGFDRRVIKERPDWYVHEKSQAERQLRPPAPRLEPKPRDFQTRDNAFEDRRKHERTQPSDGRRR